MSRYQDVFNKYGYRENSVLVHGNGRPASNVTVLVTNGDLDGQTPLRSARQTFHELKTCKAKVELPTGRHCVSSDRCVRDVVQAFYSSAVACISGSLSPEDSSDLGKALQRFDSGSCRANKPSWTAGFLDIDICGLEHHSFTCSGTAAETGRFGFAGGHGVCDQCFGRCVQLLDKAKVPNSKCICAAEASRCGARGNCTDAGMAFCSKEAANAGCDSDHKWCQQPTASSADTPVKSALIAV